MPEVKEAIAAGRLAIDGEVLAGRGDVRVTKAAIERCGTCLASRRVFGIDESLAPYRCRALRRYVHRARPAATEVVFLPPIGGITVYVFGDVRRRSRSRPAARSLHSRRVQRPGCVRL
ncbi:MAG: hypothetical protein H6982_09755 [Chromatiales bacterium]|nr:hypothetical protein [Chromatiales bacterium]